MAANDYSKKWCTNPTCGGCNLKVDTDRETCLFCDQPLMDYMKKLGLGKDVLGGLFGGGLG